MYFFFWPATSLKSEQEYFFLSSDLLEDINQGPSIKEEEIALNYECYSKRFYNL